MTVAKPLLEVVELFVRVFALVAFEPLPDAVVVSLFISFCYLSNVLAPPRTATTDCISGIVVAVLAGQFQSFAPSDFLFANALIVLPNEVRQRDVATTNRGIGSGSWFRLRFYALRRWSFG